MRSSGSVQRHDRFNPIQIKDGKIVRLSKDGNIREVLDTWPPTGKKKK